MTVRAADLMCPWLNAGATAFLTSFQCSSVGPVSKLVPPRNCAHACHAFLHIISMMEMTCIQAGCWPHRLHARMTLACHGDGLHACHQLLIH